MTLRIGLTLMFAVAGVFPVYAQQQLEEPFTPSARWAHYVHRTYSPERLAVLAVDTAIDQGMRDPRCWNGDASSYGRRFGRALERRIIRNSLELGGGLLTGEDLRYRPSLSHTFHGRVWNALRSSVTAHMPDGTIRPAYTRFFASAVTNLSTANLTRERIQPEWMA